jgi:hypothetical protein
MSCVQINLISDKRPHNKPSTLNHGAVVLRLHLFNCHHKTTPVQSTTARNKLAGNRQLNARGLTPARRRARGRALRGCAFNARGLTPARRRARGRALRGCAFNARGLTPARRRARGRALRGCALNSALARRLPAAWLPRALRALGPALSRLGAAVRFWRPSAVSLRSFVRLCRPAGGLLAPSVGRLGLPPCLAALFLIS